MKMIRKWILELAVILLLFSGIRCSTSEDTTENYPNASYPEWFSGYSYYPGSRYFYLPDVAVYYDNFSREFIYWDGFTWTRSPWFPDMYGPYNLYNSYIIVLDSRTSNPWYYHQYYSSEYPRNYYYGPRDYTRPRPSQPVRGYNENDKNFIQPRNNQIYTPSPAPSRPLPKPEVTQPGRNLQPAPVQPQREQLPQREPRPSRPNSMPDVKPQPNLRPIPQLRPNEAPQRQMQPSRPQIIPAPRPTPPKPQSRPLNPR